jgi:hypothetical protein
MNLGLYHRDIASIADGPCEYPKGRFSGAGIVLCAGGRTYFTCAWVLTNLLRHLGCGLPIEVWYRGRQEMNDEMRRLLESVPGVRCMNAAEHGHGCRLNGWEIKPYAVIHSSFEEVLFLDCDNVPTRDPSFLLDGEQYRRLGAVFWPDRWMRKGDKEGFRTISPQAWEACGLDEGDEPEFESGQMLVDKRRCWRALQLTMFLNEHSSFFYRWLLGDKDTFHMAWRRVGQPYAMPMFRPEQDNDNGPVLYQRGFDGQRLFQHRNQDKWDYDGGNIEIPGFVHEAMCLELVGQLRRQWDGTVRRYPVDYTRLERTAIEQVLRQRLFHYAVEGAGLRLIEMKPGFEVGLGKGAWETAWDVEQRGRGVSLTLHNGKRKMCVLDQGKQGTWHGRWLHFERAAVQVAPIARLPAPQRSVAEQIRSMLERPVCGADGLARAIMATRSFLYKRIGHDARLMEFIGDHTIARGAAGLERWWFVDESGTSPLLHLWGESGLTCSLSRQSDGVWKGSWQQYERMPVELVPDPLAQDDPDPDYYAGSAADPSSRSVSALRDSAGDYYGGESGLLLRGASASYYGAESGLLSSSTASPGD